MEQKQYTEQWITTFKDKSIWTISLNKDKLFNETSTRSLYFINQNSKEPVASDSSVVLDDDRNIFNRYLELAIEDLTVILARRIPQSRADYPIEFEFNSSSGEEDRTIINDKEKIEFYLIMSTNHDSNLLNSLVNYCREFLVCRVLEKWYNVDFGSAENERKIIHVLQYRRRSSARKVRPLL